MAKKENEIKHDIMVELRANLQYSQLSLKSLFSKENGTAARLNSRGKTHRGSRRV